MPSMLVSQALLGAVLAVPAAVPIAPQRAAFNQALGLASALNVRPVLSASPIGPLRTVAPLATLASSGDRGSRRPSSYEEVRALFEAANGPVAGGLERWRAGRLFKPEKPETPYNSLLVGAEVALPDGSRGLRFFPIQTLRPVDEIPERPDLVQWVRDLVRGTPVDGPGPDIGEREVRFGLCRGGVCHRYAVRRGGDRWFLRYEALPEAGGAPIAVWYGFYDRDVTPVNSF